VVHLVLAAVELHHLLDKVRLVGHILVRQQPEEVAAVLAKQVIRMVRVKVAMEQHLL
jgi:hypothetical protein